MHLFFHDVGLKGANADFPKTVFGNVTVSDIVKHCPAHLQAKVGERLLAEFPDGLCNAWGVPGGAKSIISQLEAGDVMLLIKTTGGDGEIPVLCHVRAFWKEQLLALSNFLWGSSHFPYVFFFKAQKINLTWTKFKEDVQYKSNFRPSGNVYRVKAERLENFGGSDGYVRHLLQSEYSVGRATTYFNVQENTPEQEYAEGERRIREVSYFKRNTKLVEAAKAKFGFSCQICGFNFESVYGKKLGFGFIECHHKNPLCEKDGDYSSTVDDVCVVCSNCHRMLHRVKPAMKPEALKEMLGKNSM